MQGQQGLGCGTKCPGESGSAASAGQLAERATFLAPLVPGPQGRNHTRTSPMKTKGNAGWL